MIANLIKSVSGFSDVTIPTTFVESGLVRIQLDTGLLYEDVPQSIDHCKVYGAYAYSNRALLPTGYSLTTTPGLLHHIATYGTFQYENKHSLIALFEVVGVKYYIATFNLVRTDIQFTGSSIIDMEQCIVNRLNTKLIPTYFKHFMAEMKSKGIEEGTKKFKKEWNVRAANIKIPKGMAIGDGFKIINKIK